jgi:hypothetical protein
VSEAACRICACTFLDCSWCIVLSGEPCHWVEHDLCSYCAGLGKTDEKRAQARGRVAWDQAHKRGSSVPGKPELLKHCDQVLRVYARHFCVRVKGAA